MGEAKRRREQGMVCYGKRYYHGGVKGLKAGDKILPPCITGKSTLLTYSREIDPDGAQREDKVYLTTSKEAARMYAAVYPFGDVYEVTSDDEVEVDPDCLERGLSFQCSSAIITRIIATNVTF